MLLGDHPGHLSQNIINFTESSQFPNHVLFLNLFPGGGLFVVFFVILLALNCSFGPIFHPGRISSVIDKLLLLNSHKILAAHGSSPHDC